MRQYIRPLDEPLRAQAKELLRQDSVGGGLIHSLIIRHGFGRSVRYWGLWDQPVEGADTLAGIITLDDQGRSTIFGGGPAWCDALGELIRGWLANDLGLDTVDAPESMAAALAAAVPPRGFDQLEIMVCLGGAAAGAEVGAQDSSRRLAPGDPTRLTLREVVANDCPVLVQMYREEPAFRWVNVPGILGMCADGHRFWLVGLVDEEIVTAGWANTLEPGAARVSGIVTKPDYRGRGYATELTSELTRLMLGQGRTPYLYVSATDPAPRAVYSKLGYRLHSRRTSLLYGGEH